MTAATLTPPLAPAKVLDIPPGFEFIDGQLVEKAMGAESSWVASEVFAHVRDYCRRTSSGVAFVADTGFQCFPHDPAQVRKPDVSVLRCDPATFVLPRGWVAAPPVLVVEVVSPNETVYDLNDKIDDFRSAGTPLIWVIDPPRRQATVHRGDGTLSLVVEPADLSGEGVLPGLAVPLAAVLPAVRPAAGAVP
jgi:Uma2 family endonuclease